MTHELKFVNSDATPKTQIVHVDAEALPRVMAKPCAHKHGGWVHDLSLWVCGCCFKKLPERPKRWGMVRNSDTKLWRGPRQQVVWMAAVIRSAENTTISEYLRTMAIKFTRIDRTLPLATAYNIALESLEALGVEFGDPAFGWSHADARDMAVEEAGEWEMAGGGNE
jgi:hypothetical protein